MDFYVSGTKIPERRAYRRQGVLGAHFQLFQSTVTLLPALGRVSCQQEHFIKMGKLSPVHRGWRQNKTQLSGAHPTDSFPPALPMITFTTCYKAIMLLIYPGISLFTVRIPMVQVFLEPCFTNLWDIS